MTAEALPPRQQATRRWPVVGERDPEPFDPATWRLEVRGLVERPLALSFAELVALPRAARSGTLHCVTRWSRPESAFEGIPLEALLERARPLPAARLVRFASGRGHDTTLPLGACAGDVLVALAFEGRPVEPVHGGPVRTVLFRRYFYKSVKWLRVVELLAEDRPGFWEKTSGYHNGADPWREERYALPDLDRRAVEGLLRGRDLRGRELRGLELERRDLRGADLGGSDLDGADLRGADLRGTAVRAASMACTTFCGPGGADPARVEGADFSGSDVTGLLEEQREFLRARGIPGAEWGP